MVTPPRNVGRVLDEHALSETEKRIVEEAAIAPEQRVRTDLPTTAPDTSMMDRKREPVRIRVQRTFRVYPELLEALGQASVDRKRDGFDQWSQDAIINHCLAEWLHANGYAGS